MSYSDVLCHSINQDHPEAVLTMARSLTKQDVASAAVVHVSEEGLKIGGRHYSGRPFEVSITFKHPVESMGMVKTAFLQMCKQVEGGSPTPSRYHREIGQPPGWRVYWPDWTPFLIALAIGVASFFYIYFFPDTRISILRWIKDVVGMDTIRFCVHFAIGLHSFQTITAWYLMKRIATFKFTVKQVIIWSMVVQFFGIGSMLKLLPLVYYSKFASEEESW